MGVWFNLHVMAHYEIQYQVEELEEKIQHE
jgi:hypothetical protein